MVEKGVQFSFSENCQKYLGVQASSAAWERIFSTAGHIFSLKRRRMSLLLITKLVFLKLDQEF